MGIFSTAVEGIPTVVLHELSWHCCATQRRLVETIVVTRVGGTREIFCHAPYASSACSNSFLGHLGKKSRLNGIESGSFHRILVRVYAHLFHRCFDFSL